MKKGTLTSEGAGPGRMVKCAVRVSPYLLEF